MAESGCFSFVPEDVVFNIFFRLQDDPRNWARLACVCTKFSSIVRNVCCKTQCYSSIPTVVSELLPSPSAASASSSSSLPPPGGWASLYKLAVCCPGLFHAGILLENSDFGLERELGPDQSLDSKPKPTDPGQVSKQIGSGPETPSFQSISKPLGTGIETSSFQPVSNPVGSGLEQTPSFQPGTKQVGSGFLEQTPSFEPGTKQVGSGTETPSVQPGTKQVGSGIETPSFWSLYDDLYTDTLPAPPEDSSVPEPQEPSETTEIRPGRGDLPAKKRRKISRSLGSHLASGGWSLSREQGNKLLASRFRGDSLYICNWPGCIHVEDKRNYMLFRGVFKDFKRSRVWRTISDGGGRSKVTGLKCAFCECDETWDMHSSFCLRRVFGFHDDGEPVVRAYVCENGHVSGAWTNLPLYT